uniref:Uncharacterized protein n=1 Tax=Arion vulgaris TaxID=1028688 RepID=A0A0B6XY74_9EUPU
MTHIDFLSLKKNLPAYINAAILSISKYQDELEYPSDRWEISDKKPISVFRQAQNKLV